MGLAANQARLLTLQSRMNDLELQCMRCSNDKIVMSMLSSNVSIKYNKMLEAAENQGPTIITTNSTTQGNKNDTSTAKNGAWNFSTDFNYNNLKTLGYDIASKKSGVKEHVTGGGVTKNWVWDKTTEQKLVSPEKTTTNWVWDVKPGTVIGTNSSSSSNGVYNTNSTSNSNSTSTSLNTSDWKVPTTIEELADLLGNKGLMDSSRVGYTQWNGEGGSMSDMGLTASKNFTIGNTQFRAGEEYSISDIARLLSKTGTQNTSSSKVSIDQSKIETLIGSQAGSSSSNTTSQIVVNDSMIGDTRYGHYETVTTPAQYQTVSVDNSKIGNSAYGHYEYLENPTQTTYEYVEDDIVKECKSNAAKLKEALVNGTVSIYKDGQAISLSDVASYEEKSQNSSANSNWSEVTTSENISYADRDKMRQAAETWFSKEMGIISQQEKMLDLKAKNAETQYQAACTEFESVKSLVSKNTEKSFSIFS